MQFSDMFLKKTSHVFQWRIRFLSLHKEKKKKRKENNIFLKNRKIILWIYFIFFQSTSLRDSTLYVKYYSLIGSLIVMVLIPIIILITTCIYLRSAIPDGQHKAKISRIMIIIICMFIVAHVPKVCYSSLLPLQMFRHMSRPMGGFF